MPSFGRKSMDALNTCHPDLKRLMMEVIKRRDCSIVEGHRTKETQDKYFYVDKVTTVTWPNSKHNKQPSLAVDVVPYIPEMGGQIWPNPDTQTQEEYLHKLKIFINFCGFVAGVAHEMNIDIRQGIDWNGDNIYNESFVDMPHIELIL